MSYRESSKSDHDCPHGELSSEDRQRMAKLHEEIMGRVEEMARIQARVLGVAAVSNVRRITVTTAGGPKAATVMETTFGSGYTVCYQDPPGLCCPGPCPCTDTMHEYRIVTAAI